MHEEREKGKSGLLESCLLLHSFDIVMTSVIVSDTPLGGRLIRGPTDGVWGGARPGLISGIYILPSGVAV